MGESVENQLAFPLYACEFLPDERIVVGGGGGTTKSGFLNGIVLLELKTDPKLCVEEIHHHDFPEGDDSCFSIAIHPEGKYIVCGVNQPKQGKNLRTCRVYIVEKEKLIPHRSYCTLDTLEADNYQKAIFFSNSNRLVTLSAIGKVQSRNWKNFSKLEYSCDHETPSLYLDVNNEFVITASSKGCSSFDLDKNFCCWNIDDMKIPRLNSEYPSKARFGRLTTKDCVFIIMSSSIRKRDDIVKVNFKNNTLIKRKPLNGTTDSFTVSPNGAHIGIALTNTYILVLSADNLCTLWQAQTSKELAITSLSFSYNGPYLASCSAIGLLKVYRFTPAEERASSILFSVVSATLISIIILTAILEANRLTIINFISNYIA